MKTALVVIATLFGCARASAARAQDAAGFPSGIVSVTPLATTGVELPGDARYLYAMTLRVPAGTPGELEVVTDRRLLSFDVLETGARRPLRCTHPRAPRFARTGMRTETLHADEPYTEWIDLRDYCTGRSLAALERGANVVPHYGWSRGSRDTWVARTTVAGSAPVLARQLDGAPFDVAPRPEPPAPTGDARVSLSGADRDTQSSMTLRVTVRATSRRRVYVLPDQWHFRVRSALGTHECGMERQTIVPIADFFRTIDARRGATYALEASSVCAGAFPLAGVYEVTPILTLPYPSPAPHERESLTGTFEGPTVVVRIRRGERGYVQQLLEDLAHLPPPRHGGPSS